MLLSRSTTGNPISRLQRIKLWMAIKDLRRLEGEHADLLNRSDVITGAYELAVDELVVWEQKWNALESYLKASSQAKFSAQELQDRLKVMHGKWVALYELRRTAPEGEPVAEQEFDAALEDFLQ